MPVHRLPSGYPYLPGFKPRLAPEPTRLPVPTSFESIGDEPDRPDPRCPRVGVRRVRPIDWADSPRDKWPVVFYTAGGRNDELMDRHDGLDFVDGAVLVKCWRTKRDPHNFPGYGDDAKLLAGRGCYVTWSHVREELRKRGCATALYEAAAKFACGKYHGPLYSDARRSAYSQGFWGKQSEKGRARCLLGRDEDDDGYDDEGRPEFETPYWRGGCYRYGLRCPAPASLAAPPRGRWPGWR